MEILDIPMQKKNSFDLNLTLLIKINSNCIKDLNIKYKTIKLSEEIIGEILMALGIITKLWFIKGKTIINWTIKKKRKESVNDSVKGID